MDKIQKNNFRQDKSRNKNNKTTVCYLWCFRSKFSKGFSFSKFFSKIAISLIWKGRGIGIETANIGGGRECLI